MTAFDQETDEARLLRKAVNLFTFLGQTQQVLVKPVRTVDKFEKVLWFGELPDHPAIRSAHTIAALDADAPLLVVDRLAKVDPPTLPGDLTAWVDVPVTDEEVEPTLRQAIYRDEPAAAGAESEDYQDKDIRVHRVELADVPEVSASFETWLADWQLWAEQERRDARVRDIYKELFAVHLSSTDHSEEFELVCGIGCLSWRPEEHDQVRRHIATASIAVTFDENSGALTVLQEATPESVTIEIDMLDPALIASPAKIDEIRQLAGEYDSHLLDQPAIGAVCRRLIHRLDADADYDEDELTAPTTTDPRGAFAPAVILRRRTNRGLVQIYEQIVAQLRIAAEVPSGLLPLIDPDQQPAAELDTTPGAMVSVDDEVFLPLPVNETQRRIIDRVDRNAQTIVQGPPGTGKTHTAAALVSHLLAKGMRVLITAHTDRALHEVRGKLPREIQSLAVSVIGQSRSDMAELRTAVDNISRRADEFDMADSRKAIERHLGRIDDLRRRRADAYGRLITIRQQEVETRADGPEEGTLAAIAYRHLLQEEQFSWIRNYDVDPGGTGCPLSDAELAGWRTFLRDQEILDNQDEATLRLPALTALPTAQQFADLVGAERTAAGTKDSFAVLLSHESFAFVHALEPALRDQLRSRVSDLAERAGALERRDEAWMNDALRDVRSDRQQLWQARSYQVKSLGGSANALIAQCGPTTTVGIAGGDVAVHQQIAKSLLAHIDSGKEIKVQPDGSPKIGAFTSKTVKLAEPFFAQVKVNGLPAVTREQLDRFVNWVEASRTITAMDQAWPVNVEIPDDDTLGEKLQWHYTEVAQLDKVLDLGSRLEAERAWFKQHSLPVPDWNDLTAIRRYAELVEAAAASDAAAHATSPIEAMAAMLKSEGSFPNAPAVTAALCRAAEERDISGYSTAHDRLTQLHRVAVTVAERDRLAAGLKVAAPHLAIAIADEPDAVAWDALLANVNDAWRWELTGRWILAQDSDDSNALKVQLNALEQQIRTEVEHLAAERAWQHAVAPGRLTGSARANLTQYAQLVSSLGKGTGKYAAKRRVEIADAMDRCRPSVPVWIMPIYRIAEQMRVQPNLFDVVIVDEASQAGLEASFLQYLAPKMVVIGDDKQVSPSAVGVDQQQLRDLANMYLVDDPYKASWQDPKRSYFDEANMRFGSKITLTEHRRCVPEIIGFSNRVAYEPEGIRLVPVRQFGAERLEPIKVVHVTDGFEGNNKTNEVEAQAIVDQIRLCLSEPRYDGATIGVISLLGKEQARLIEHKLLDAVPPEEWSARELRCGDASDFQGSERDVMFLSMVKAATANTRLTALTATQYVQRFNVAASRAKDQMWVYHSMPREALTNTEDMRFQLLDYCYGVVNRGRNSEASDVPAVVPDDVLIPPFDSLFEQRIFNKIADRGYTVIPQYPSLGYNIDLVIVGAKIRLAVECDGDFWHGPAQYESDLARQRELERCGWEFFRIRESVFYADMPGAMQKLWDTLDELGIQTANWIDPTVDDDEDIVEEDIEGDADDEESTENVAVEERDTVDESTGAHNVILISEAVTASGPETDAIANELERPRIHVVNEQPEAEALTVGSLRPYTAFEQTLPVVAESEVNTIVENLVRIVEVEGPVLGHRLHQVYVRAAGGQRVGREIARLLNTAIVRAERRGLLKSENPLNEPGVKPKTFRTPAQSAVVPRELGPRALDMVPPAELAHHFAQFSAADPDLSEDELYRAMLDRLGLKRLTENARTVLSTALALVERNEMSA